MAEVQALARKRILVTRPREQAAALSEALRSRGAEVVEAPAIRIEPPGDFRPLDEALRRLNAYDWIVFTSVNGVEAFFERRKLQSPEASLAHLRFAAIGPATARRLADHGFAADVVPERFVAEEVFRALRAHSDISEKRFLLPRADIAREALPRLLRETGARVDVVAAYRTLAALEELTGVARLLREGSVDAVTFTSGSTVRSFFSVVDASAVEGKFVAASIGPITSEALRESGIEPAVEATDYTTEGLVEALVRHFGKT